MDARNYALLVITVAIIFFVVSSVEFEAGSSKNLSYAKKHSLFFESTCFSYPTRIDVKSVNSSVTIGFAMTPGEIDFGIALADNSISRKFVNITNRGDHRLRVSASKYGNISGLLTFAANDFILEPGQTASLGIAAKPENVTAGNYSGSIELCLRSSRFSFMNFML